MSVHLITPKEAMLRMDQVHGFSAIIDARSEDEFALDHLPQAVNWPSLSNQERILVGTLYKQVSPFEAQKRGAALVAANIASHIEREVMDLPKRWEPLIYCWRGGKRSGSLSLVLGQIGFKVHLLEGGYKAFRRAMLEDLPQRVLPLHFKVISGPTGSGKTRLLQALREAGGQVLDLEALAAHRSSVLGRLPGQIQPSQKNFDMRIWHALRQFNPAQPVFVESESRKVGNVSVPEPLIHAIRQSPCYELNMSLDARVALLLQDYDYFVQNPALLQARLDALVALRGRVVVQAWQTLVQEGRFDVLVRELLVQHYDPTYAASMQRNFTQHAQASTLRAASGALTDLMPIAQQLLGRT